MPAPALSAAAALLVVTLHFHVVSGTVPPFGFPQLERFQCAFNFTSNACGDGAEHDEIYESFCYGPYICRPLGPLSCSTCTGNSDPGFHVFERKFDAADFGTSPLRWRVVYPPNCIDCPVMVFVPTRAAKVSLEEYDQYVEQVVSFGVVVVIMTSTTIVPFDIFYPDLVKKMNPIFNYITGGGLAAEIATQGSTPRTDKLVYAGHGQGARIAIQRFIENSCTGNIFGTEVCDCENGLVGGMVLLSPTEDISTQADVGNGLVIQENVDVAWTTPALLINGDLDATVGSGGTGFCSPTAISDDHFFNNWDGPIWRIRFENFGHHDISDHDQSGVLCRAADLQNDADKDPVPAGILLTAAEKKNLYRRSVAGATAAFIDGLLNNNPDSFLALNAIDLGDNLRHLMFDREDLDLLPARRNVPANVGTAGVTAGCTYRGKLFSDEIQALLYATYALGAMAVVFGIPYLYYRWIWKPIQKMKEDLPEGIREELAKENLFKPTNKTKNPTYNDGLQKLTTPVTPPPGMDDGLSAISSVRGSAVGDGDESVVPYSTTGNSVRMSAQTRKEDDDIF